ncbi:hypothetical protein K2W90_02895 [Candidatus Babeliales bacterium]|nr:hypothetical protein [Candidatus Babeliales bacterium]
MNSQKKILEENLKNEPNNIDILLKLALLEVDPPEGDEILCAQYIEKILALDEQNVNGLLLLAYFKHYILMEHADENLMQSLTSLQTSCNEVNSMLRYAASWFFFFRGDEEKEIECLRKSINYYQGHVWNYVGLGRSYLLQGKNTEGKELIRRALSNVKVIYSGQGAEYDGTNISHFLDHHFKGICLTQPQLELIQEDLIIASSMMLDKSKA